MVTRMDDVPDEAGREMTVGARHACLRPCFCDQKAASKSLYRTHMRDLDQEINRLRWSDPSLYRRFEGLVGPFWSGADKI